MKITTVGIDLAKNVFQVHGIDERGKAVLRKQLRRAQVRRTLEICRRARGSDLRSPHAIRSGAHRRMLRPQSQRSAGAPCDRRSER